MVTLYVLRGTEKRYVGITNKLERRLREHASGHSKAGQIIGDFKLVHTESFADQKEARQREKYLKSGQGREWMNQQDF